MRGSRRGAALALSALAGLLAVDVGGQTTPTLPQQPITQSAPVVALVTALAWPIAAIVMALAFRRPLGDFLGGLAGRVTKLSAFKVELELAAVSSDASSPLLDDIRSATTPAAISDSSRTMLEQAQSTLPADFAVINLGAGAEWITSRLFIASVMLERMRGVQVFVFLENTPGATRRFVAVGSLPQVRWALAQQFPWLEAAWARAYLSVFPAFSHGSATVPNGAAWLPDPVTLSMTPSPIESSTGALNPYMARQIVGQFMTLLQETAAPPAAPIANPPSGAAMAAVPAQLSQMQPSVLLSSGTLERATSVTRELLETLLPQEAFDVWTDVGRDAPRMRRTRSVLRRSAPFVALVQGDREFVRLVNRTVLLEEMASSLGEEPESSHGS
jgi:hypothetical protein